MTDINRREFAGSVLLAALAPVLGIGAAPVERGWWEPAVEQAGDDLDALAKALAEVVRVQYGDRLGAGRPGDDHPSDQDRARQSRRDAQSGARQRRRARLRVLRARRSPDMSDLSFQTIPELGRLLRGRKLSSVELTGHFLERLERLGPTYNAVVTVLREPALAEAKERDRELRSGRDRGPLHGIPYGAKDLLAAEGAPTTWGAQPYRDQLLKGDATVVAPASERRARCCAAKLAMVELAGGMGYNQAFASFTGPGKTPWDVARWSGGSSSGSGAAVGAGLVPFAIGSETWGSIQFPAAFCGVTGLRPTYGRVSRHGAMALSWTMDKLGPLGRTAEDCGLVLAAIAGPDPADPSTLPDRFVFPSRSPREGTTPHRRAPRHAGQDPARGPPELRGVARRAAPVRGHRGGPGASRSSLRRDGGHHHRRRGGERLRAALPERADHRAHRARGPHRRLRRPGRSSPRTTCARSGCGGRPAPRSTACWPAWTPSPRRASRPWPGPSTPPSTRCTRTIPAGPASAGRPTSAVFPGCS